MANITNYLNKIKTAVYGKDVRGAIHDAIKQVYDDASVNHDNANMEVKMARGTHNTLNDRLDNVDEIQAQTNAQLAHNVEEASKILAQVENISNKKTYIKSNGKDDTEAIQLALNKKGTVILNDDNYYITDTLYIPSDTILEGNGTINCINIDNDCLSVNTSASNIKIKNLTIKNATRFGIQIHGERVTDKPHNIVIEGIKTIDCLQGGIFLNSCYDVNVKNCFNNGGVRAIGTFAPINDPFVTHNIIIDNCDSVNTTGFGHQTYYGKNITIKNCDIDGSLTNTQDKSCITIDRSQNVIVTNNVLKNAISSNIFVTGVDGVTLSDNVTLGGEYGIQCIFNLESQEDATIKENKNTVISNNIVKNASNIGIILNSCLNHNVIGNSISDCDKAIYIMQQIRDRDGLQMESGNINIVSNITNKNIELKPISGSCDFLYNVYNSLIGVSNKNKVIDNKSMKIGGATIENVGLIKKINTGHTSWIYENRYSDESYHKGWVLKNSYGSLVFSDSEGRDAFIINVSDGNNKKDIRTTKAGAGLIVTSPDGSITKRIGISNNGEITLTSV